MKWIRTKILKIQIGLLLDYFLASKKKVLVSFKEYILEKLLQIGFHQYSNSSSIWTIEFHALKDKSFVLQIVWMNNVPVILDEVDKEKYL